MEDDAVKIYFIQYKNDNTIRLFINFFFFNVYETIIIPKINFLIYIYDKKKKSRIKWNVTVIFLKVQNRTSGKIYHWGGCAVHFHAPFQLRHCRKIYHCFFFSAVCTFRPRRQHPRNAQRRIFNAAHKTENTAHDISNRTSSSKYWNQ